MKPVRAPLASAITLAALTACAAAQSSISPAAGRAEVSFRLERPGLPVPRYLLTVGEDGTGSYDGEDTNLGPVRTVYADAATPVPPPPPPGHPGEPFHQPLTLTPATAHRIFALARTLKQFNVACASKAKNIADTGAKTLTYRGPAGAGSCTYNYSENKNVVQLTDLFYGIAETMDEGRRLDHLHRYDRLGLDAAIGLLAQEVTDGRAVELGSIAGTLRSIASDADVMQRVRVRASQLLSLLPAELQTAKP